MTDKKLYPINTIYTSIQGEGFWSGYKAAFLRFSGCNLDCSWCDTEHDESIEFTLDQLLEEFEQIDTVGCKLLVITGGEPLLFLDDSLGRALLSRFERIVIETNGTLPLPGFALLSAYPIWVTWSPKDPSTYRETKLKRVDEIKVVVPGGNTQVDDTIKFDGWTTADLDALASWAYKKFVDLILTLQPMTIGGEVSRVGLSMMTEQVFRDSCWRASIQLHKLLDLE